MIAKIGCMPIKAAMLDVRRIGMHMYGQEEGVRRHAGIYSDMDFDTWTVIVSWLPAAVIH